MGVRSTNTTQSFGSDFYRSGSDVTRAYVNQVYTEDVFHTQIYDGITNGGQTITTNIDLANRGGLVWIKKTDGSQNHTLSDTEQGLEYHGTTAAAAAFGTSNTRVSSPTSTGFNLGSDTDVNEAGKKYVSWTFRKEPGFFDIVTWDGDPGTGGRTLEHSLGSTPGFIIVKQTTGTSKNWAVWHRSLPTSPAGSHMYLNTPGGVVSNTVVFPSTSPTSTQFGVGEFSNVDGESYVAYLFAHDDHRFGDYEDQDIIKCGKETMPPSGDWHDVDLGWEPQWILVKPDATTTNWQIFDSRRGIVTTGDSGAATGNERELNPNTPNGEDPAGAEMLELTGNGFRIKVGQYGTNNDVYYVAIRKGIKKPTDATKVFNPVVYTGETDADGNALAQDFAPVDLYDGGRLFWAKIYTGSGNGTGHVLATNKTGLVSVTSSSSGSETSFANIVWDDPEFVQLNSQYMNLETNTHISWNFKTAAGFFDIVTWQGNDAANRALTHNLGVQPELLITKRRTANDNWNISTPDLVTSGEGFFFNTQGKQTGVSAFGVNGVPAPTSSVFYVGSDTIINGSSDNYIALLFASCPGVSKVGTYSGNTGNNVDVDCGFTSNARFVMIKRTDTQITGTSNEETNWWIFGENLGITSGNDYVMQANTADARVTANWLSPHPDNKGFRVNSGAIAALNATGGTYLYLAIA